MEYRVVLLIFVLKIILKNFYKCIVNMFVVIVMRYFLLVVSIVLLIICFIMNFIKDKFILNNVY